jgi:steroid 5-alpha reductase family enzyme
MWKTILLLLFTIFIIPFAAFYWDTPYDEYQWEILKILLIIYVASAGLCFIVSSITKNYSQVDKLWSIIPIIYAWVVCVQSSFEPRILLMAALVTIWGVRLTYNFNRRGGYKWRFWEGEEDYRWSVLQAKKEFRPKWKWVLFNLSFISFYQMGLILLFTLPILRSVDGAPLGIWDYVLSGLILLVILIETMADQQQWNFQKEKRKFQESDAEMPEKFEQGFINTGLWAHVRHPNYAAEQLMWILFYFFSVIASGQWVNSSVAGFLLLVILFQGSADFSEAISSEKYPKYKYYIKSVPRFIPGSKGKSWKEESLK